jgi:hypothetical protein
MLLGKGIEAIDGVSEAARVAYVFPGQGGETGCGRISSLASCLGRRRGQRHETRRHGSGDGGRWGGEVGIEGEEAQAWPSRA